MAEFAEFNTKDKPTWCPGCGNHGILMAVKNALAKLELERHQVVEVGGIGCSSKLPYWVNVNGFASLHGRAIPVASGIKFANRELTVIVNAGDGDTYGIGIGHFVHALRRNLDITLIVHDNQVYGLTKGQASPTAEHGYVSPSTPHGAIEQPINSLAIALANHGTFAARGYAADVPHLTNLIVKGIQHKGLAVIDVFQPCITFNHVNTFDWFKEHVYKLEETDYHPQDRAAAIAKALEWSPKIPIGILYQENQPTYEDEQGLTKHLPLVKQDHSRISISSLVKTFQ